MSPPPMRSMSALRGRTHFPYARGPYSVGCVDVAGREALLRLFYPHRVHSGHADKVKYLECASERWANWYPEPEYAAGYVSFKYSWPADSWLARFAGWVTTFLTSNPASPVVEGARLFDEGDGRRFPLVVFSHGNGGCRMTYSAFCAEVASRGFLVAALEHADGSACAARKLKDESAGDGGEVEWVPSVKVIGDDYGVRNGQVTQRAEECDVAARMMEELNDGEDQGICLPFGGGDFSLSSLKGRVDLSRGAALCGHSFGGSTVVKALLKDDKSRFSSAFCLDAWMLPIKFESAELASSSGGDKALFFLNYEKFQWRRNLATMRLFAVGLEGDDDDEIDTPAKDREEDSEERRSRERATAALLSEDGATGNVATIKKAIHYVASDLPLLFAKTWLGTAMAVLDIPGWFKRRGDEVEGESKPLTAEQGLHVSEELFLSFLRTLGYSPAPEMKEGDKEAEAYVPGFGERIRDYGQYLVWGCRFMGSLPTPTGSPQPPSTPRGGAAPSPIPGGAEVAENVQRKHDEAGGR